MTAMNAPARRSALSEGLIQATASEAHAAAKSSIQLATAMRKPGVPGQSEKPTHDRAARLDGRQAGSAFSHAIDVDDEPPWRSAGRCLA